MQFDSKQINYATGALIHDNIRIQSSSCTIPGCGGFLTGAARGAGRGADLPASTMTK
jgi:hypothetical protein